MLAHHGSDGPDIFPPGRGPVPHVVGQSVLGCQYSSQALVRLTLLVRTTDLRCVAADEVQSGTTGRNQSPVMGREIRASARVVVPLGSMGIDIVCETGSSVSFSFSGVFKNAVVLSRVEAPRWNASVTANI